MTSSWLYHHVHARTLAFALILGACGDDAADDGADAGVQLDAGPRDAGSDAGGPPGRDAATGPADGGPVASDAATTRDAAMTDAAHSNTPDASGACMTFCTCMASNCTDKVFPMGCLTECAQQTDWDLPCRQNMCGLVPAQPNNDHCTHAMGVNECLDM